MQNLYNTWFPSWLILLLFASLQNAAAQQFVPENAGVTLESDKAEYFLGENVLVHFKLENTGGPTFRASFGGDYRGSGRSLRFKVSATDQDGIEVADPHPSTRSMGGFIQNFQIIPAEPFYKSLPILRYLRFERPGTYTIKVRHDCGWRETSDRPHLVGEITILLKRPSEQEARELVQSWFAEGEFTGTTSGMKSVPHADFGLIRFSEYLPALSQEAKKGNAKALAGVGSIATPEATKLLIEIANSDEEETRKAACRHLGMRLPDPYLAGELGKRNPFHDELKEQRGLLIERSWRKEFSQDIKKLAMRFLKNPNSDWIATGAYMMECVGTASDTPSITAALSREVRKTKSMKLRTDIYPRARGACMELQRALKIMLKRGAAAPEKPSSHGESILFLIALLEDSEFRPDSWVGTCDQLLKSSIPYIQEQTLKHLPSPMPETLQRHLEPILRSSDIDASIEACRIIEKDKLVELREPILDTLRTATERWLFNTADNAAFALETNYERIEILVSRLDEPEVMFKCLDSLKTIFSNAGGGGHNKSIDYAETAKRIKPKWESFIRKHESRLRAGEKFILPHPEVTPDMFPKYYHISLKDGTTWPEE